MSNDNAPTWRRFLPRFRAAKVAVTEIEAAPPINKIFVSADRITGRLARYEKEEWGYPQLTHLYEYGGPAIFPESVIAEMRDNPPDHLKLPTAQINPSPTPPNAVAARAA